MVFSQNYTLFLDGQNITNLVSNLTVEIAQSSIHNSISFSSISEELYLMSSPALLEGLPRLLLEIEDVSMSFLLEERSGQTTLSYWGRDLTAQNSAPWVSTQQLILNEWRQAKEVCESLLIVGVLNWEIMDWLLPPTLDITGTPLEIIQTIISEIGAILRAQNDGSITVRYKYPILPTELPFSTSFLEYPPDLVVGASQTFTIGEHYNRVSVYGDTKEKQAPILELEETNLLQTENCHVNVYWYEEAPEITNQSDISTFITDGSLVPLERGYKSFEEFVVFEDGEGRVNYPIFSISSVVWIGTPSIISDDSWGKYRCEITIEDSTAYKIAKITYLSEYFRYLLTGHNVEMLIGSWGVSNTFNKSILVATPMIAKDIDGNLINKEGEEIVVNYLTNSSCLVKCGLNWIIENKYNVIKITFESPYRKECKDGQVIWVDLERVDIGFYYVVKSNIVVLGAKFCNQIEVIKWEV